MLELCPRWSARGGGSQYALEGGCGQYPPGGGGGGHIEGYPAAGDPLDGITGGEPI
jgi:hypothetical protein